MFVRVETVDTNDILIEYSHSNYRAISIYE